MDDRLRIFRLQDNVVVGATQVSGQTLDGVHGHLGRLPSHLLVDCLPDIPSQKVDHLSGDCSGHSLLDSALDVQLAVLFECT